MANTEITRNSALNPLSSRIDGKQAVRPAVAAPFTLKGTLGSPTSSGSRHKLEHSQERSDARQMPDAAAEGSDSAPPGFGNVEQIFPDQSQVPTKSRVRWVTKHQQPAATAPVTEAPEHTGRSNPMDAERRRRTD